VHLVRDALPDPRGRPELKVVGVGNPWRGDDAAGLVAARTLRKLLPDGVEVLEREGEPASLIDAWEGADAVWVVDAVRSGAAPGTVHRLDATERPLPAELFGASTHHLGLADGVELARVLGRLPRRLVVFGIEGASFAAGEAPTPAVSAAAGRAARAIRDEVCAARRCGTKDQDAAPPDDSFAPH
jgi:hydrogenase maturation protease